MTQIEKIEALNYMLNRMIDKLKFSNSFDPEVIDLAIVTIEKQIPREPIKNRHEYYCPRCKITPCTVTGTRYLIPGMCVEVGKINTRSGEFKIKHDYCHRCGQKIDWEKEK